MASFIATSNMEDILSDPSGNRRFLGVELTGPINVSQRPNYEQLYAQALSALRAGVRDFRGINGNGFDGRGNFACGIKEQIIFPEIDFEKVDAVRGMDVCFVTTAKTDEEGKELLKALGAPFAENN